ncbi:MAG TPA: ROK family protein [Candidatus Dormibacteraeota bacterium]|jgi:predicted NBD/HSP70 family sugar kinase|nr:ROK family protein [Candidatus Dormibacteraeota bacterium]
MARHETVADLRRANRGLILRELFLGGTTSRVSMARSTALSSATVTNVVAELLEEGAVVEAGTEPSNGARPAVLLRVNPDFGVFVGIDVGETKIRIEAFDFAMTRVARVECPLGETHTPEVVVRSVGEGLADVLHQLGGTNKVVGIGVGVPGVVAGGAEPLVYAPAFGWRSVPLVKLLRATTDLPIVIENGAKTMGQAEMWFGAGRGTRHAVIALLGTGVGAAIFANGVLYRGATSSAGEWGHTTIVIGGRRCRCGARGCLEAYVGAGSILDRWARESRRVVRVGAAAEDDLVALLDASVHSRVALRVIDETARYLAEGVRNLVNLFDPERVVIGGWAGVRLGPAVLDTIRAHLAGESLRHPAARLDIQLGQLGPDAVALGAATLVADRVLNSGGERQPRRLSRVYAASPT